MPIRTLEHIAWVAGIAFVALLVGGFVSDWRLHSEIAIFAVAGTIPSFASNLPATLRIEWELLGFDPFNAIDESLYKSGWQKVEQNKHRSRYVQRLPRWLRWETGEISIEAGQLHVVARGPVGGLSMLQKRLLSVRSDA